MVQDVGSELLFNQHHQKTEKKNSVCYLVYHNMKCSSLPTNNGIEKKLN